MTIAIGIATAVCIVGGAVHVLATNPRWAELGRLAFGVGLFVALSGAGAALSLVVN